MRGRIMAVLSGAVVLGVGATMTLASWTDTEWVSASLAGDPTVGTSVFEVEQNTTSPFDGDDANWVHEESNPGGGMVFSAGAMALSPGTTVYAPVALRTAEDSAAATIQLREAVPATGITINDPAGSLWDAMELSVYTSSSAFDCDAAGVASATSIHTGILGDGTGIADAGATQSLSADSASTQYYCFALTLPASHADDDTLQGRTIAPAWLFDGESV